MERTFESFVRVRILLYGMLPTTFSIADPGRYLRSTALPTQEIVKRETILREIPSDWPATRVLSD
jgi:hypothetical protein